MYSVTCAWTQWCLLKSMKSTSWTCETLDITLCALGKKRVDKKSLSCISPGSSWKVQEINGNVNAFEQNQGKYVCICRRSRDSKCEMTQVQFSTGQTEALLTMIVVREYSNSISSSVALVSPKWLQRPSQDIVSGRRKRWVKAIISM